MTFINYNMTITFKKIFWVKKLSQYDLFLILTAGLPDLSFILTVECRTVPHPINAIDKITANNKFFIERNYSD